MNCSKLITKIPSEFYKRYTKLPKNNFCSSKCKGIFDSKSGIGIFDPNQTHVKLRSKLEEFLELKILEMFPYIELEICNRTLMSGLELDFYIPLINLAIEVNGIFHYEPIYSQELLNKIQIKDNRKIDFCFKQNIDLIIIKSIVDFHQNVGNNIWNLEIKPELLKRIPFCENKNW